jgi:hypothetical protein
MKRWPAVCVFAWAVAAAVAADAPLSELAPPGTKVAIGINVRAVLDSAVMKELPKEFGAQEKDVAAGLAGSLHIAGFDPLKDVDQVWLLAAGTDNKAPMLVVVRGRFDAEKLANGAKRYKGIPIMDGGQGAIGLLGSEVAIAGDTLQVQAAIDRLGSGAQLDPELKARIEAVTARYDIWGIGEIPEGVAIPTTGTPPGPSSIDRFMFGLTLRQGESLTAEFHTRSTEDAANMTAYLSMIQSAWKERNKDSTSTLDVQSENGTFRISVVVPEEELQKGLDKMRALMAAGVKAGAQPAAAPAPAMPETAAAPPAAPSPTPTTVPEVVPAPEAAAAAPAVAAAPAPAPAPEAASAAPATAPAPPAAPEPAQVSPQPPSVAAPPAAPKPANQPQIVKAPNGDTLILRLPGAK